MSNEINDGPILGTKSPRVHADYPFRVLRQLEYGGNYQVVDYVDTLNEGIASIKTSREGHGCQGAVYVIKNLKGVIVG